MEQQIETEESPPAEEKNKATSSTGIAILFGVGLAVAFAVGLIAGFVMRPMVIKDVPVQVAVTVMPAPVQEVAQAAEPTMAPINTPTPEPSEEPTVDPNATPTPSIMEFVLADARHFQGSEDASVTLIEFSDFK